MESELQVYCPSNSSCTNIYATMAAKNDNCRITSFPKDNQTFLISNNGMEYGVWYGDALPGTCEGNNGDLNRDRLVVFSFFKNQGTKIVNSTTLFCKPSYKFQQSTVTLDESGSLRTVDNSTLLQTPVGLTATDISNAVRNTLEQFDYGILLPELASKYGIWDTQVRFRNFFMLMMKSQGSENIKDVWDSDLMIKSAQDVFRGAAAQLAKRYFLAANDTDPRPDMSGTVDYDQQRLFVRTTPLRLMEAVLGALILVSFYLGWQSPQGKTPQDPASIARLASIISQSKEFVDIMSPTGSWRVRNLKHLLKQDYTARFEPAAEDHHEPAPSFVIEGHGVITSHLIEEKEKYWQPMMTSWYARLALPVIPVSIVIALEILFQQSQHSNGLLNVTPDKQTQMGFTYVPALVMVLTKLLFSGFDFNLRISDPYVQLKKGFAKAKPSILNKTIYSWKTDAFWTALMTGRTAVGVSALGVMMASFLTVAASGLYTTIPISHDTPVNLTRLDQFYDPTSMTSVLSNRSGISYSTALAARLTIYEKTSSPMWTYGQHVVPKLSPSPTVTRNLSAASAVDLEIPVQNGFLTCQLVSSKDITLNYTHSLNGTVSGVRALWPMPDSSECENLVSDSQGEVQILGLEDGPFAEWTNFSFLSPRYCPSSWGMYGKWLGKKVIDLNVLLCWSSIQESKASVQLSIPEGRVQSLVIDESTTRNISDTMDTQLDIGNVIFNFKTAASSNIDQTFDIFLRNKTTGVLDSEPLRRENWDDLYARIQHAYGLAVAQVLTNQGRYTNLTTENATILATATDSLTFRLKQSLISTRILQGLLIGMTVCALISLFTLKMSQVLPKNPCSIAAQASLVAGSKMMADLPAEAQHMKDKEFNALFEGARYRMGWSDENGAGRFGIDVDHRLRDVSVSTGRAD
ncbi:hypothetical protein P153DRAFT_117017 [Dothidotthia symphoricarpi CBS 119687]|uniref:Uncharacterized protein n=1 Tax=Dothidotthia symphoricarpi CBS 119687 TaxID=1392245 RepID=A0A6A5ZZI9_9PLEO|nr:uncharacterized protein P153DRAFT_117017 [Dothidotthia symphoricarpi CBS 119687]KAF2124960.1 hypothetical protein P153DRAFT_117017 [Dothidotthia symphoricarpi CBS 119687]